MTYPAITALLEEHGASVAFSVIRWINKNAKPWLAENGLDHALYRSTRLKGSYEVKTTREDREPNGMKFHEQGAFNALIEKQGFIANRSNSVFCQGSTERLWEFGEEVCVIIPSGEFNYTWCRDIEDANYWKRRQYSRVSGPPRDLAADLASNTFKLQFEGDDGSLFEAMQSGNEIMLRPKNGQYLVVKRSVYQEVVERYAQLGDHSKNV